MINLFDTTGFVPRWTCGMWYPPHAWVHIVSDFIIFLSYIAIPLTLVFLIRSNKVDIKFPKIVWLFAAFILSCGIGHLVESIIFWHPLYRLAGFVKLVTALVSFATAIALYWIIPGVLELSNAASENKKLLLQQAAMNEREKELIKINTYKRKFLTNVSHEIRTPVASMIMFLDKLKMSLDSRLDVEELDIFDKIDASGKDLLKLLEDVFSISKIEVGKLEVVNKTFDFPEFLNEITESVSLANNHKHVAIRLSVEDGVPNQIRTDPNRLKQILLNLTSNSLKNTSEGVVKFLPGWYLEG